MRSHFPHKTMSLNFKKHFCVGGFFCPVAQPSIPVQPTWKKNISRTTWLRIPKTGSTKNFFEKGGAHTTTFAVFTTPKKFAKNVRECVTRVIWNIWGHQKYGLTHCNCREIGADATLLKKVCWDISLDPKFSTYAASGGSLSLSVNYISFPRVDKQH